MKYETPNVTRSGNGCIFHKSLFYFSLEKGTRDSQIGKKNKSVKNYTLSPAIPSGAN